jgi:hypothetical protein
MTGMPADLGPCWFLTTPDDGDGAQGSSIIMVQNSENLNATQAISCGFSAQVQVGLGARKSEKFWARATEGITGLGARDCEQVGPRPSRPVEIGEKSRSFVRDRM